VGGSLLIIGAVGLLWLIFWLIYYEKPEKQKRLSAEELAFINSDDEKDAAAGRTDTAVSADQKPEKFRGQNY
jgi:ACS family hexuronate transporter-like MFS transporter